MRRTFGRWFLGAGFDDIYRGNWEIWAAWVFFDHELHLLGEAEREEVNDLVNDLEQRMDCQFKPGRNPNVSCIRLTVDPVRIAHRPLAYYGGTMAIHFLGKRELERLGFRSRTVEMAGQKPETVLYRPALTPAPSGAMPIVFLHGTLPSRRNGPKCCTETEFLSTGIGVGFAHYIPLINILPRNVPIYLIEWPHVAMRLSFAIPSIAATLSLIRTILSADSCLCACFLAHSLGTAAVTWMLHDPETRPFVGSTVLLDPITFLLCDPTVAFNFIYREPQTVLELVMNYFVSQEMGIAYSLSRHFHWSRNVLFVEDLPRKGRNVIILAEEDVIVPAKAVERYLLTKGEEMRKRTGVRNGWSEEAGGKLPWLLDLVLLKGCQHGELMIRQDLLEMVSDKIALATGVVPVGVLCINMCKTANMLTETFRFKSGRINDLSSATRLSRPLV